MTKIKLLFITGTYGKGGKERQLTEIIKHLDKSKYQIYLVYKNSKISYFDEIKTFLSGYLALGPHKFSFHDFKAIKNYLKKINPKYVYSWSSLTSHISALAKIVNNQKFILINGSIRDAPIQKNSIQRINTLFYYLYRNLVSNSRAGFISYHQLKLKGRYILPNGFDQQRIPNLTKSQAQKDLNFNPKVFNITMAANLTKNKDQLTLLKAVNKLHEELISFHLYLAGDGPKKTSLENEVIYLGLKQQVTFLGSVNYVEEILLASDLSVLISTSKMGEGFPNALMEALAVGTPVIATDNPGVREFISKNKVGIIIPPDKPQVLAAKIKWFMNNKAKREEFSKNAKQFIFNKYSMTQSIKKFIKILKSSS